MCRLFSSIPEGGSLDVMRIAATLALGPVPLFFHSPGKVPPSNGVPQPVNEAYGFQTFLCYLFANESISCANIFHNGSGCAKLIAS